MLHMILVTLLMLLVTLHVIRGMLLMAAVTLLMIMVTLL